MDCLHANCASATLAEISFCSVSGFWPAHIAYGGIFVAEHPAPPFFEERPSIWTSAVIQTLLQLPDLVLHRVQQYRWGATAVKPTGLLAWNLPFVRKDLYSLSLPDPVKPDTAAIGKDGQGNFRTSKHKEYPKAFCKALAFVVAQQFERFVRSNGTRSCPAASEVLDQWDSTGRGSLYTG